MKWSMQSSRLQRSSGHLARRIDWMLYREKCVYESNRKGYATPPPCSTLLPRVNTRYMYTGNSNCSLTATWLQCKQDINNVNKHTSKYNVHTGNSNCSSTAAWLQFEPDMNNIHNIQVNIAKQQSTQSTAECTNQRHAVKPSCCWNTQADGIFEDYTEITHTRAAQRPKCPNSH